MGETGKKAGMKGKLCGMVADFFFCKVDTERMI